MVIMQINSELATQHGGGHGGLRYCGIELFFKRYFSNFDFNVRYCGTI